MAFLVSGNLPLPGPVIGPTNGQTPGGEKLIGQFAVKNWLYERSQGS